MDKYQIRRLIKEYSVKITETMRVGASDYILCEIETLATFETADTIALYYALSDEVPTAEWCERWSAMGKRVVLPRVDGCKMDFYDYNIDALKSGSYSIMEPQSGEAIGADEIDLIVVPGVAFTSSGLRLGRGKGFYDRYLSRVGFRGVKVGVGYAYQLLDELPCEPHDQRLDMVVTSPVMLPHSGVIRRVIASAWGDADRLGCGIERLNSMGLSWVLLRYRMELLRTPKPDEELSIETWICGCSRVMTQRYFVIRDCAGVLVGEAISQWCMIDLKSRRPIDLTRSEIDYAKYVTPRKGSIELTSKLKPIESDDDSICSRIHVANEGDIDFNRHVNTFKYIDMMVAMLPAHSMRLDGGSVIDLQFVHESYLGEALTIRKKINTSSASQSYQFDILHPDRTVAVRGELELV